MKARLLFRERVIYDDGAFVEMVIWRIPQPVPPATHRLKYRLAYIVDGKRIVGYDNERGKGDHRHVRGRQTSYAFSTIEALMADFIADVKAARGER
jgi:hypothetical protein